MPLKMLYLWQGQFQLNLIGLDAEIRRHSDIQRGEYVYNIKRYVKRKRIVFLVHFKDDQGFEEEALLTVV